MRYEKNVTTIDEQIKTLSERGLYIVENDDTRQKLSDVGYFRFKGYCLPFLEKSGRKYKDKFKNNSSFKEIYNYYIFDQNLHSILLKLTSRIETQFKAFLGDWLAIKYDDPIVYTRNNIFKYQSSEEDFINIIDDYMKENGLAKFEDFPEHYRDYYEGDYPIWVIFDVITFGQISKTFSRMKNDIKKSFSIQTYNYPYTYVASWIYYLTVIRNQCSHNMRTINKRIRTVSKLSTNDKKNHRYLTVNNQEIFRILFIIGKMCKSKKLYFKLLKDIDDEISFKNLDEITLGLHENWYQELIQYFS